MEPFFPRTQGRSREWTGTRGDSRNYEASFKEISEKFWEFQQMKQTPEEEEYARVQNRLETMIVQFREEIEQEGRKYVKADSGLEEASHILTRLEELRKEEERLLRIKGLITRR